MPARIAKQIYTKITQAKSVLLVPHRNPDGDALGSVTAMMHFLRMVGIDHTAFCDTKIPTKHSYLPYFKNLRKNESVWSDQEYDLVIVLDSGDLKRAGIDKRLANLNYQPTIINIDHHPDNKNFGDYNLVIPKASSTTEIIYKFLKLNNVKIDSYLATCLLTGIITDTDSFTNSATTTTSLQTASDLIKSGGDINLIKELVFKDKPVNLLRLWGSVLSRLAKHGTHEIVYTYLTQKDLTDHGVDETEADGIANFLNNLNDGKAALILKELPAGKVKGSFRTTRDDVDVSKLAGALGGGGHKKAAGFTAEGSIDEVLDQVWKIVDKLGSTR
jgi:bifunctional oligoribonuclease and PAP phosphatase NrnA